MNKIQKTSVALVIALSASLSALAADDVNTTVGNISLDDTNGQGGNVVVTGNDTLVEEDIKSDGSEDMAFENEDCQKYPERCKKEVVYEEKDNVTPETTEEAMPDLNAAPVEEDKKDMPMPEQLPKTWAEEVVLLFVAMILGGMILIRNKKVS